MGKYLKAGNSETSNVKITEILKHENYPKRVNFAEIAIRVKIAGIENCETHVKLIKVHQ